MNENKIEKFMPLIFAGVGAVVIFIMLQNIMFAPVGAVVGFMIPAFIKRFKEAKRKDMFFKQLLDGILLMVSCLKAGLSFVQAIEVLVEEMPDPISEEFKIVLKGMRIGASLEDVFEELYTRMPGEELKLMFSSILVARQTGGDLPKVLTKLVDTLRDRNKLKENIATYTIQGRLQAVIMGCIPVVFVVVVLKQDPKHFDIMFASDLGRVLLLIAVVLQIVAVIVITKVSKIRI